MYLGPRHVGAADEAGEAQNEAGGTQDDILSTLGEQNVSF